MKIDTITCHNVYNYGASLQAYALQHYLETLGHEVKIIDFQPEFLRRRYRPFLVPKTGKAAAICKVLPFMKYPYGLYKNRSMFKTWGRKKSFDIFTQNYLHLTRRYNSSAEVQATPPDADAYIAGSDQIWNTDAPNGKEPAYYLDFGSKDIKRISYAASFGVSVIKDEYKDFVKKEISNIDCVSVREATGVKIVKEMGLDAVQVIDPVFLLDAEQWSEVAKGAKEYGLHKDGYILVYDFLGDEKIAAMADKLKQEYHLPTVSVNDFNIQKYADININNAGPLEFLDLVRNAKVTIGSSFHLTAFSVIFQKDFYVYPLFSQRNSSRMKDFLNMLGLQDRFAATNILGTIDYGRVNKIIEGQIKLSKAFIISSLV